MDGESLRGMEHITDFPTGKIRQAAKIEANQSVVEEQNRQLLEGALSSFNGTVADAASIVNNMKQFRFDATKLSRVYGTKTSAALMFARRSAEEDAREAAEILAQDL